MIDEGALQDLLGRLADEIPIPAGGPDRVVDEIVNCSTPTRSIGSRFAKPLLVAAAVGGVVALAIPALHSSSTSKAASAERSVASPARDQPAGTPTGAPVGTGGGAAFTLPGSSKSISNGPNVPHGGAVSPPGGAGSGPTGPVATGPVDGAKIVKTGTLDLEVFHATLRVAVNRVSGAAVGLGGYVADSKTSYGGADPTAEITIRVPVANFDSAIAHLDALPGVTVLSDSENGDDVTGQVTNLQAQLTAATVARDGLLGVLAGARTIGDILAVTDRLSAANAQVDQLQGQINLLNSQATFSSLAVTLSEKPVPATKAVVHHPQAESGLAKSWSDARSGFADVIEWLIARSGGALIILLAALALAFGIRYLSPIVRRGLV
jgi:hypothetical protein